MRRLRQVGDFANAESTLTARNTLYWDVRTGISEERIASFITLTWIRKLEMTSAVFLRSLLRLLLTANVVPRWPIPVTLMTEGYVPTKRLFSEEPWGVTTQETAFLKGYMFLKIQIIFTSLIPTIFHIGFEIPDWAAFALLFRRSVPSISQVWVGLHIRKPVNFQILTKFSSYEL
jgi:hypothetical protein